MRYQNKKTGKIGEVIHYKGITTTLRFDDGSELILSPYNVKEDWVRLADTAGIKQLSKSEFYKRMKEYNSSHSETVASLCGVIVYSQDNFDEEYSEDSRSYRVWNNNKAFRDCHSSSLFGDSLDNSDLDVRLDMYDWKVDYCYFEGGKL